MVKTVVGKYIFLDIVGYSYKRTVEAQTHIIDVMNGIVKDSLKSLKIIEKQRILIPTGDGMCIALLDVSNPFDVHMELALKILEKLNKYNKTENAEMRQFKMRIGVNENTDNLITDVNGNKNVAGAGITEAQRIMDQGNAGNVVVGRAVYHQLCQREKYIGKFKGFPVMIKHKQKLEVYQFIDESIGYLNSDEITTNFIGTIRSTGKKIGRRMSKEDLKKRLNLKKKLGF